jgi:hypothetical protein
VEKGKKSEKKDLNFASLCEAKITKSKQGEKFEAKKAKKCENNEKKRK